MPEDNGPSREADLERTDRLPILDGTMFDHDVEDDAVRMDAIPFSAGLPSLKDAARTPAGEASRAPGVDLPSLAESVRSVEDHIARQAADYDVLKRSHDEAREAESVAVLRADAMAAEIAGLRDALEAERLRSQEVERSLNRPVQADLQAARATILALGPKVERGEADLSATRHELSLVKAQAHTYLEQLRSREYRRGFEQNVFRELDAKVGAAEVGHGALEAQRDQLRQHVTALQSKIAVQDQLIATLQANADLESAGKAQYAQQLLQREQALTASSEQIVTLEVERERLIAAADLERRRVESDMSEREAAFDGARELSMAQIKRAEEALAAAESYHAEVSTRMLRLRQEADARDVEMAVLVANLQDARRPVQPVETEVRRLTDALALKAAAVEQLNDDNGTLRTSLEHSKAALEERESLIRRLEHSESNDPKEVGRIRTSTEHLRAEAPTDGAASAPVECSAELVRLNGGRNQAISHTLGRRTRIGRVPGCELQIDYTSVSRHHALVLMGPRDVIIEDLNSTNGVIVNGRKISRQLLNDGDLIVIGEVQFRLSLRLAPRVLEAAVGAPSGANAMG